jgi:hypothetical protein
VAEGDDAGPLVESGSSVRDEADKPDGPVPHEQLGTTNAKPNQSAPEAIVPDASRSRSSKVAKPKQSSGPVEDVTPSSAGIAKIPESGKSRGNHSRTGMTTRSMTRKASEKRAIELQNKQSSISKIPSTQFQARSENGESNEEGDGAENGHEGNDEEALQEASKVDPKPRDRKRKKTSKPPKSAKARPTKKQKTEGSEQATTKHKKVTFAPDPKVEDAPVTKKKKLNIDSRAIRLTRFDEESEEESDD